MFDAPKIITQIPDIAQIYSINDKQAAEIEEAIERLEGNIILDTMSEENTKDWERFLKLPVQDDDTLDDRRLRVKAKNLEKLPYTYRVIISRLNILCPNGYSMEINQNRTYMVVKVALKSKKMIDAVENMLESYLPLNITLKVIIMYNTYEILQKYTYEELQKYTYKNLREEVLE